MQFSITLFSQINGTIVAGSTTSALSISTITQVGSAVLSVTVTNMAGAVTSFVTLSVVATPSNAIAVSQGITMTCHRLHEMLMCTK